MGRYIAIERTEGDVIGSTTMGDGHRELVINIKGNLENMEPSLSTDCCIYRVPDRLRNLNKESFTPQVVSIGPFHHSKERLKITEKFKLRCLERFLQHFNCNVEDLVDTIKSLEGNVRRCYAETIHLSSDEFVKLILLDSCFIIVYFISQRCKLWSPEDEVLLKPLLTHVVRADLRLLENQLPFFLMNKLFNIIASEISGRLNIPCSFIKLSVDFFSNYNIQGLTLGEDLEIKHFVDLVRTLLLPSSEDKLVRGYPVVDHVYSASQLNEAGLKFKASHNKSLIDLQFTNGVLEIPFLKLGSTRGRTLRNISAFEMCHYPYNAHVCDYIILMSFLLRTTKDDDLLIDKGILVNKEGKKNEPSAFFNDAGPPLRLTNTNTCYIRMAEELNAFYEVPWHGWKATFKRDYLSTPWRTFSTIAAVTLLVLTLLQTIWALK